MTAIKRATLPASERGNDPNDHRDDPDYLKRATSPDPMAWTEKFVLRDSEMEKLRGPDWIYLNLVIRGHLIVIAAQPNGGKTTILAGISGEMVTAGYRVFYVNADISVSDAARFIEQARIGGWVPMLPDLRPGLSMDDVVEHLATLNASGQPLDDVVFVFDTLKKMTDVISKSRVKELLGLLRSLTGKGATCICLAHTNKYVDAEGMPIYEGTGDVRSDCDELIYLIPIKNPDGSMTVSTKPDKTRGDFEPITFRIGKDRSVTRQEGYIDTAAERKVQDAYDNDLPEIDVILAALESGKTKQSELVEHCKEHRISKRAALRILNDYAKGSRQQWRAERALEHNMIRYYRLSSERQGGG